MNYKYFILSILFFILMGLEIYRPLRIKNSWTLKHFVTRFILNFLLLAIGNLFVNLVLLRWVHVKELPRMHFLENHLIISFIALDLIIYSWHYLNHRMTFLWRFHKVHHYDLEMDVTTAVRFHFMELFLSSIYRIFLVLILGINLKVAGIFEVVVTGAAMFHHANIKLPFRFEKTLQYFIVTPRMHELHHSILKSEYHTNLGTFFSLWDKAFRTMSSIRETSDTTIGLQKGIDSNILEQNTLIYSLKSPFV